MALGGEEHLDVLGGGIEHRRYLIGRHDCRFGPLGCSEETRGVSQREKEGVNSCWSS